ncbi:hypothetical protein [Streptomyces sp. NPDC058466]|uniref:hypothetical protein n=1 Tax=Streptomyces sp. NPDC058466 TaxID=3346512 RepID=UPI0036549F2F
MTDTDPLAAAIETAIWSGYSYAEPSATGLVMANPRTVAAVAAEVARAHASAVAAPAPDQAALVELAAQAIRDSNGTPEALEWWRTHPQLIPAHVYAAAVLAVLPATTDRADVAAVRALHQPMQRGPFTICAHCSGWDGEWRCLGVVTNYPCPTLRALDDAAAGSAVAGHTGDETGRETLAAALDGLHTLIATSSRDWQTYRVDAWIWAVLCGWDCEQDEHDDTCTHGALEETAAMHGWDADTVAKARRYRAAVRALTEPAAGLPAGGAAQDGAQR